MLTAADLDTQKIREIMSDFESSPDGKTQIPEDLLQRVHKVIVDTNSFDDDEIESTILKCSQENGGYLLCPHTAVAVKYFYQLKAEEDVCYVCIATASPAKFPEAIEKSGLKPYNPPEIQALFALEEKYETMEQGQDWEKMLREKIVQVSKWLKHSSCNWFIFYFYFSFNGVLIAFW